MLTHEWCGRKRDGDCLWCGRRHTDAIEECPKHPQHKFQPRPFPGSYADNLGTVGERLTQIRKEEAEAMAAAEKAAG